MNTFFALLLAMMLTPMGGTTAMSDPNAHATQPANQSAVSYQIVPAPYPQAVQEAAQAVRQGGHQLVRTDKSLYVVIGAGQRPTGGYRLVVDQVMRKADGGVLVRVHEQKPQAGAMAIQVITYPTVVIALPADVTTVSVEIAD